MNIYKGLNHTQKINKIIIDSISKAKESPNNIYSFIVDDPAFYEEAFLKHTNTLFNIEIITFDTFLENILKNKLLFNTKKITKLDKIMLIKKLLENDPSNIFNMTPSIFNIIDELIGIFDEFYLSNTTNLPLDKFEVLSKNKLDSCFKLYQLFLKQLPPNNYLSLIDPAINVIDETFKTNHYCFITNDILNLKALDLIKKLDCFSNVSIIVNCENDNRNLNKVYQSYFNEFNDLVINNNNDYLNHLINNLFSNQIIKFTKDNPFCVIKETTLNYEINSICLDIYQQLVTNDKQYHNFAIYYPNNEYLEKLKQALTAFNIPFNNVSSNSYFKELVACILLLEYSLNNNDSILIKLLDTTCLTKCNSYKQSNYFKKLYLENNYIDDETYQQIKDSINKYSKQLNTVKSINEFSSIIIEFINTEFKYSDNLNILINFFNSFSLYNDLFTLADFKELVDYLKPPLKITNKSLVDHVYLFNHTQVYSGILGIDDIYLVGINETIVPKSINDQGILLNHERHVLKNIMTIQDNLSLQQNDILKILGSTTKRIVLSYSSATTSGEPLLESSLINHLKELYNFKYLDTSLNYLHPSLYFNVYKLGGEIEHFSDLNMMVKRYKETKNQPSNLSVNPYSNILSVSQLETYNSCPYKYYLQYGLKLYPLKSSSLEANEIGSLVHYVLDILSNSFENIEINNLKNDISTIINQYLDNNILIKNKLHNQINQYFINCLKEDLFNTILILINQMKSSTFKLKDTESKVSRLYNGVNLRGVIDRIDIFRNYLKIIDYKSSDKDLDLNLAMQGFNIQMLIYIDILAKNEQLEKGAILYFNTKKRILKSTLSILEDESEDDFIKLYKMNGYVLDDVIEEIDKNIDGTSNIIKVKYVKTKNSYSGNILDKEAFNNLVNYVSNHINELYQQISNGDIKIAPKGSDDITTNAKVNPCTYCKYRTLCNYDTFYNEHTLVDFLAVEKILGGEEVE